MAGGASNSRRGRKANSPAGECKVGAYRNVYAPTWSLRGSTCAPPAANPPDVEIWRPVVGHEGSYEVSDQGRVRSVDRVVHYRNGRMQHHRGMVLTPFRHPRTGHLQVSLSRTTRKVHHLVLEAFVGPRPARMIGLHANDIPADNRVVNLRWGTDSDNKRDSVRNGSHVQASKTRCIRGHVLSPPNLCTRSLPMRQCAACDRASALMRRLTVDERTPELRQAIADQAYAEIMGTSHAAA